MHSFEEVQLPWPVQTDDSVNGIPQHVKDAFSHRIPENPSSQTHLSGETHLFYFIESQRFHFC